MLLHEHTDNLVPKTRNETSKEGKDVGKERQRKQQDLTDCINRMRMENTVIQVLPVTMKTSSLLFECKIQDHWF
jgi:hypothetical protein